MKFSGRIIVTCCLAYNNYLTSMSAFLTVKSKFTLAASHAVPWWVTMSMPTERQTDGRTPDRCITHSDSDAASLMLSRINCFCLIFPQTRQLTCVADVDLSHSDRWLDFVNWTRKNLSFKHRRLQTALQTTMTNAKFNKTGWKCSYIKRCNETKKWYHRCIFTDRVRGKGRTQRQSNKHVVDMDMGHGQARLFPLAIGFGVWGIMTIACLGLKINIIGRGQKSMSSAKKAS